MSSHSEIPSASDVSHAVQEEVAGAGVEEVVPVAARKPPPCWRLAAMPESWTCAAGGITYWSTLVWKGKQYMCNIHNEVWLKGEDGGFGEWQGIFKPMEDRFDDSVPEPVSDDEE